MIIILLLSRDYKTQDHTQKSISDDSLTINLTCRSICKSLLLCRSAPKGALYSRQGSFTDTRNHGPWSDILLAGPQLPFNPEAIWWNGDSLFAALVMVAGDMTFSRTLIGLQNSSTSFCFNLDPPFLFL